MRATGELLIHAVDTNGIDAVQALWREYWDSLSLPSDFQGFGDELRTLPGAYAPPGGLLLLAIAQGTPAGTAGFRRLSTSSCEAKRMYVRPQSRGNGIGKALLDRLVAEARTAGYHEMYADTLKSMTSALQMYRQMGFVEVAPYSSNPTPGAIFLRTSLSAAT